MKTSILRFNRFLLAAAVGAGCVAAPMSSDAREPFRLPDPLGLFKKKTEPRRDDDRRDDRRDGRDDDRRGRGNDHDHRDWHRHERDRDAHYRRYTAVPRSSFIITFGSGWAGQGYYYGPPNQPYYYQTPGVSYYRTREAVPRQYYPREWGPSQSNVGSADAAVQRALARRGYYNGPIDGDIGPGTRAAIARYQRDRGLRPTGVVDSTLLRSLGL